MGKPAARIGDLHTCPKVTPGTPPVPHAGGPVFSGCLTVLIEGQPAARVDDLCTCVGEPDRIVTGASGVFIGGKPAARMGDRTEHGGKIVAGSRTVWIGGKSVKHLSPEEKIKVINEAIEKSIVFLEKKLQLLEQNDFDTLIAFKKWFGKDSEESRRQILERMRRTWGMIKGLQVENFNSINSRSKSKKAYGLVYSWNKKHNILLGDKFWKEENNTILRAGVIIHEMSHFRDIGNTDDFTYGERGCLELARQYPEEAINNADSFEFFIRE